MAQAFQEFDVVINGGGMVGMSLAVALARAGIRVALIERMRMGAQLEATFDGRVSAIAYGSKCILDGIGAWEGMQAHAEPILDIRVSDGNMPFYLHYDHKEVGNAPFGYIVENRHIRHALHKAGAEHASLTIFDGTQMESFERDDAKVTIRLAKNAAADAASQKNAALQCKLLVAADGKNSSVRKMAGIGALEWGYGQTAIVCTIEHDQPHGGLAQERFLPAGPFAVLPMTGNRSSLVWVEPDDRVGIYLELLEEEFLQEIQERVGNYLGTIRSAGLRFSYPLSLMHAKAYTGHRLALIGDAAHGIHPIAGQGVNLGFRDVGVLSELVIERFRLGLDVGTDDVLRHYQRWRRFDNVAMLAVTDGLNRLFGFNALPVKLARDMGMWVVGRIPPLKKLFMKHAMGMVGDVPEIVKENRG